jgi:hypothetical protein
LRQSLHWGRGTAIAMPKRLRVWSLTALITAGAATPALAVEGPPTQAPTVIPPTLQALQQKMAEIHFNTARVSIRSVLGDFNPVVRGELATGGAGSNRLITTTSTALSYSPRALTSTSTLDEVLGKHKLHRKFTERLISRSLYFDIPTLARTDGGRPWVRSEEHSVAKPHDSGEDEPLAVVFAALSPALATVPQPGAHGTFAGLSEDLAAAQSVHEISSLTPLTVDGEPVSGFTASIPIASLLAHWGSPERLRRLLATAKPDEKTVALEVFIAPSGLPVRTTTEFGAGEEGIAIQEDVLGLDVPVVVTPPPAALTITQARLDRLESKCPPKRKTSRSVRPSRAVLCKRLHAG